MRLYKTAIVQGLGTVHGRGARRQIRPSFWVFILVTLKDTSREVARGVGSASERVTDMTKSQCHPLFHTPYFKKLCVSICDIDAHPEPDQKNEHGMQRAVSLSMYRISPSGQ